MDVRIGILKKGDKVINVLLDGGMVAAVSVQRKNGEVDIVFLKNDETDQLVRVVKKITICEGDDMVILKEGDLTMRKF